MNLLLPIVESVFLLAADLVSQLTKQSIPLITVYWGSVCTLEIGTIMKKTFLKEVFHE